MSADDFIVTPWHVEGDIDYDKLIKKFGTEKISSELVERIKKITNEDHFMLRRGIFFSHREMNRILDDYEKVTNSSYTLEEVLRGILILDIWYHGFLQNGYKKNLMLTCISN